MSSANEKTIKRLRSFTEALESLERPPLSEFIDVVNDYGPDSRTAQICYETLSPANKDLADLALKLRKALVRRNRGW